MKESLYGWYPPAKGAWRTHNQDVSSYAKESLYKFTQSKYADHEEGIRTPTPQSVKIRFASRAETIKTPVRSVRNTGRSSAGKSSASRKSSVVIPATPGSADLHITGRSPQVGNVTPGPNVRRPQSASSSFSLASDVISVGGYSRPPSCLNTDYHHNAPCPKTAWLSKTEATPITVYDASGNPTFPQNYFPIPKPNADTLEWFESTTKTDRRPTGSQASSGTRRRAQSATIRRETPATPPRPVQSARPENRSQSSFSKQPTHPSGHPPPRPPSGRSCSSRSSAKQTPSEAYCGPSIRSRPPSTSSSRPQSASSSATSIHSQLSVEDFAPSRPVAPHPPDKFGASPPNGTKQDTSPIPSAPLDYDEELKKHGWRMEIPGDPLNLKGPCLRPRESYVVGVYHPRPVPLKPPMGHMENYTTFFTNTIPRKPMTFTLHPEMISEVLHAKRMELQKRNGMIYQNKNFSFVY